MSYGTGKGVYLVREMAYTCKPAYWKVRPVLGGMGLGGADVAEVTMWGEV
jgi:hypothetical protein